MTLSEFIRSMPKPYLFDKWRNKFTSHPLKCSDKQMVRELANQKFIFNIKQLKNPLGGGQ